MEHELQILKSLYKSEKTTQRDISKSMGISLGSVNILIKRLVKKGMIEIERLSKRTTKYIVTPQGFKHTLEETYKCIIESYRYINTLNSRIDSLLNYKCNEKFDEIVLLCERDEIFELIENKLNERNFNYRSIDKIEDIDEIKDLDKILILIWQPNYINSINDIRNPCTNLLDYI